MLKKRKTWYLICGLLVCTLVAAFLWMAFAPGGPIVISRETTYLTAPIGPNGEVDYWTYVETERARGVTLEKNAVVPLLRTIDFEVCGFGDEQRFAVERLGLEEPSQRLKLPAYDEQFHSEVQPWILEQSLLQFGESDYEKWSIGFAVNDASFAPWQASDFPPLAEWLARNGSAIDQLHDLDSRTRWYFPKDPAKVETPRFVSESFEWETVVRRIRRMLRLRGMLHLGNGDVAAAWRDLRSELRLCVISSNLEDDTTEWERCVGLIDNAMALHQVVIHPQCSEKLLWEIEQEIASVRPPCNESGTVLIRRIRFLQLAAYAYQNFDAEMEDDYFFYPLPRQGPLGTMHVHGNAMLRRLNHWFDQEAAAAALGDFRLRRAAVIQLRTELHDDLRREQAYPWRVYVSPAVRSRIAADVYYSKDYCYFDDDSHLLAAEAESRLQLLRVSMALQRYRLRQGAYPIALADMLGDQSSELLQDSASAAELRYRRREDGYVLYSVGENLVDDGGNDARLSIFQGRPLFRHYLPVDCGTDWAVCAPSSRFELLLEKTEEDDGMGMDMSDEDIYFYMFDTP